MEEGAGLEEGRGGARSGRPGPGLRRRAEVCGERGAGSGERRQGLGDGARIRALGCVHGGGPLVRAQEGRCRAGSVMRSDAEWFQEDTEKRLDNRGGGWAQGKRVSGSRRPSKAVE